MAPAGHALAIATERARFLAEQAPAPMALTKAMLAAGLDAALEAERHFQTGLFLSADHAEGKAAFMGKRAPSLRRALSDGRSRARRPAGRGLPRGRSAPGSRRTTRTTSATRAKRLHWHENRPWYMKLAEQGWLAPGWPREHGGMGLSAAQASHHASRSWSATARRASTTWAWSCSARC